MKLTLPKLCIALLFAAGAASGQTYQHLSIASGLNQDVIANGVGAATSSSSIGVDNANYAFMAANYQATSSSTAPSYALPVSGLITSAANSAISYQLAPYNGNNAPRLQLNSDTGTITFSNTPAPTNLYVLATGGSGAVTITSVITFTDATTQTITGSVVPDWYNSSSLPVVASGFGRVSRNDNVIQNETGNPRMYQLTLGITTANQGKQVSSIQFTKTSTAEGTLNVFAVSAQIPPCTPPPAPTAVTQNFCGATTVAQLTASGAATGGTYNWYATQAAATPLASTASVTTGTYYVAQQVAGCESTRIPVTVNVTTTPAPDVPAQTVCGNTTVADLGAIMANGATANWYTEAGGEPLAGTDVVVSGTYYVTQTLNGCEGPATQVEITVSPAPLPVAPALQTFCFGATVADLVAQGVTDATMAWSYQGVTLEDTVVLTADDYEVRQTVNGCTSDPVTVTVAINTVEAPTVDNESFCGSATGANLTATTADGAEVHWYNASGDEVTSTTNLETGTYSVTQTVNGCTSDAATFVVAINPVPDAPAAPATQTFTEGATIAALDAGAAEGNGFAWYTRDEAGEYFILTTDTPLTDGATYYVAQTNGDCESDFSAVTVSQVAGLSTVAATVALYPNPAATYVTLGGSAGYTQVTITNILGQTVLSQPVQGSNAQIDISGLAAGTYIVRAFADGISATGKMIKQ